MKLNLGCGDKILSGYVNVDVAPSRAGKRPDVVCDLHRLERFEDGTADEILAVHVVEHFWRWEIRDVMREWVRVLKSGGRMVIECPNLASACKIVGASSDPVLLQRCEAAMREAVGTQATAVRSQSYYLDVTPPGHDKGTFVEAMAKRLEISTEAVAAIGDMQNDLAMFKKSGLSIAMGNATDDVKKQATEVTASNEEEGFAKAIEMILRNNAAS